MVRNQPQAEMIGKNRGTNAPTIEIPPIAESLLGFAKTLVAVRKMEDLLPVLVQELTTFVHFDAASLLLWPRRPNEISFWQTFSQTPSGRCFMQRESFVAEFQNDPLTEIRGFDLPLLIGRTHWVENYHEESLFYEEETAYRQTFYVPLLDGESNFGVLQFRADSTGDFKLPDQKIIDFMITHLLAVLQFLLQEKKGFHDPNFQIRAEFKFETARTRAQLASTLMDKVRKRIPFRDLLIMTENGGDGAADVFIDCTQITLQDQRKAGETYPFMEKGLFAELVMNRGGRIIDQKSPFFADLASSIDDSGSGIKEALGIALIHEDKSLGVLYITAEKKGLFSSIDPVMVQQLADQLAMALANILQNEEIAQSATEKAVLLAVNNHLSALTNRYDLIQGFHKQLHKYLIFPHSSVALLKDHDHSYFMFCDALSKYNFQSEPGELASNEFLKSEWTTGMLFSNRDPQIIDLEVAALQKDAPGWLIKSRQSGLKAMTLIRLTLNNRYTGSLIIFSDQKNDLTPQKLLFLNQMARQFSFSMNHMIAIELAQQKEKEKSQLVALGQDIAAIRNKVELQVTIEEKLKALFPIDGLLIYSFNPDNSAPDPFLWDVAFRRKKTNHGSTTGDGITINQVAADKMLLAGSSQIWNLSTLLGHFDISEHFAGCFDDQANDVIVTALTSHGKNIGMMLIFTSSAYLYNLEKLQLLEDVSSLLGAAVTNVLTNEDILKREAEKNFLLAFCNEIAAVKNSGGLSAIIRKGMKGFFNIDKFFLLIKGLGKSSADYYLLNFADQKAGNSTLPDMTASDDKRLVVDEQMMDHIFSVEGQTGFRPDEMTEGLRVFLASLTWGANEQPQKICASALRSANQEVGTLWTFQKVANQRIFQSVSAHIATAFSNIMANENINRKFTEINEYKRQLEEENLYLQEEIQITHNYSEIIGNSLPMRKVFKMLSQVSESSSSVLILGETGTGKELIARAIHNTSLRKDKIMVKVNCAALPANLIESELFGHEKGSFTGAIEKKIGKFELANNGTLFLDEIGELPLDLQVKILRAIQEKEIERVGGRAVIKIDVRIIAATNRNLQKEVRLGTFRSDLYFRLNVFPITLPSLRERSEDIPDLAQYFLDKYAKKGIKGKMTFSSRVLKQLSAYEWPGNVRELEHLIERSILLTGGSVIEQIHLPSGEKEYAAKIAPDAQIKTIDELEREHIIYVLKKCKGKVAGIGGAAELLKIPSTTLNSKIRKLKIKKGFIDYQKS